MISMLLFDLPSGYEYDIVFMRRDLPEIVASQDKMLKRLGKGTGSDSAQMGLLLDKHLRDLEHWLVRQKNMRVLYVQYKDVVARPGPAAARIRQFLDVPLDEERMVSTVDPTLYRNKA